MQLLIESENVMQLLKLLFITTSLILNVLAGIPAQAQNASCNVRITTDKDRVRINEGFSVDVFTGETIIGSRPSLPIVGPPLRIEYEISANSEILAMGAVMLPTNGAPIYFRQFAVDVKGITTSGLKNISARISQTIPLIPKPANCTENNTGTTLINVMAPDPIPILATSYTGLWWNQATDGQGIFFTQNSPSNIAFIGWFTYDKDGKQKWYAGDRCDMGTTSGGFNGNVCTTTLYETSDGKFDGATFNGGQIKRSAVGEAGFKFHSNQAVTMTYSLNGVSGRLELQRQPF